MPNEESDPISLAKAAEQAPSDAGGSPGLAESARYYTEATVVIPRLRFELILDDLLSPRQSIASAHWEDYGRSLAESRASIETSKEGTFGEGVMKYAKTLEDVVSAWSQISVHSHRFGGREFLFGSAEVGHVHTNGIVDIPFTRPVHDLLLAEGLAEQHRWVPNSGWITFRIRSEHDIAHAVWLLRLSYLRYALKEATDPRRLFERECEELRLSPRLKSLLEPFVPNKERAASAEPLPA